eukprot:3619066-Pyramimonas_sp.AAC.1
MAVFGEQFSSGDQGSLREKLWANGFTDCPKCQAKKCVDEKEVGAGCRKNGDGYGTAVFTCKHCNFNTSFQYDEASEPYYYETRYWNREEIRNRKELTPAERAEMNRKQFELREQAFQREARLFLQKQSYDALHEEAVLNKLLEPGNADKGEQRATHARLLDILAPHFARHEDVFERFKHKTRARL